MLEHAHLLPGDGEARVAEAMSGFDVSSGPADGLDEAVLSGRAPGSAAAQAREAQRDLSSALMV